MLRNILINNVIFGDIGLTGGWSWFQQQGQIVVWIALGYLAGKEFFGRKYEKMIVVIVFGSLLALLVNNPGGLLTPVGNLVKKVLGLG